MIDRDFRDYGIENVDADMITETNAQLDQVNLFLIRQLDKSMAAVRSFGCEMVLLPDGLTTGVHRTPWHARGLAVDVAIDGDRVPIYRILKRMITVGWTGIGIYHNGQSYRVHLDMRPALSIWGGVHEGSEWYHYNVFRDPADPGVREWVASHSQVRKPNVHPVQNARERVGTVSGRRSRRQVPVGQHRLAS